MNKLDKKYVSPADQFLKDFDQAHSLSESQQAEIAKYEAIAKKRDNPLLDKQNNNDALWD